MNAENFESKEQKKVENLSAVAMTRRHALLKGAGKGAAVLGASIPLQTLASTSVFTYNGTGTATQIRCGVSGMTSGIHSRDTGLDTQCKGYSPLEYKTSAWPSGVNKDALITTVCKDSTLKTWVVTTVVETPSQSPKTTVVRQHDNASNLGTTNDKGTKTTVTSAQVVSSLFDVISFHDNTNEYHWVCAWLNGMGGAPAAWQFPYTGSEVIAFYNSNNTYPSGKSPLDFFMTYMEKHS